MSAVKNSTKVATAQEVANRTGKTIKHNGETYVPTIDRPLPSGWVRQSTIPTTLAPDLAVSKFTTQTQRRVLRAIVRGEDDAPRSIGDLSPQAQRTIDRLKELKYVTVSKAGGIAATKAGETFVAERTPAIRVRSAAKPKAGKNSGNGIAEAKRVARQDSKTTAKPAKGKRVVKRTAKAA